MPKGIYKRKGHSEETRKKISESNKISQKKRFETEVIWNMGKTGLQKHTKEWKEKLTDNYKGKNNG